eukprot:GHVS01067714.1.p1 GENE.GHVS01067714.1~~GHVS01067714.1.p1  ORF type:complete len:519 (-),score=43.00 GHVS01067714.1:188-1744(-)
MFHIIITKRFPLCVVVLLLPLLAIPHCVVGARSPVEGPPSDSAGYDIILTLAVLCGCLYILSGGADRYSSRNVIRDPLAGSTSPVSLEALWKGLFVSLRLLQGYCAGQLERQKRVTGSSQSSVAAGSSSSSSPAPSTSSSAATSTVPMTGRSGTRITEVAPPRRVALIFPLASYFSLFLFKIIPDFTSLFGGYATTYVSPPAVCVSQYDYADFGLYRILLHPLLVHSHLSFYWMIGAPFVLFSSAVCAHAAVGYSNRNMLSAAAWAWTAPSIIQLMLWNWFDWGGGCIYGIEGVIFCLGGITAVLNPILHTESLGDSSLLLSFPIQLRWTLVPVLFGIYLSSPNLSYIEPHIVAGLLSAIPFCLVLDGSKLTRRLLDSTVDWRNRKVLFWLTASAIVTCWLPFSMQNLPTLRYVLSNVSRWTDLHWIRRTFQPSLSINDLMMESTMPVAFVIGRFNRFSIIPILFSKYSGFLYWIAAAMGTQVILGMNLESWIYPNIGFLLALYLAYKFCCLPTELTA